MLAQLHTLLEHDYLCCSTVLSLASVNHSFLLSLRAFINKNYSFFWPTYPLYPSSSPLNSLLASNESLHPSSPSYFAIYSPSRVKVTPDVPQGHLFPPYVTKLTYTCKYEDNTVFPINLKEIYSITLPVHQLPKSLEVLSVDVLDGDFNVDHLPTNLKIMRTNSHFTTTALDHLPCMLTELSLGLNHPYSLDHLPSSLLKLFINESAFNQPLDHLPPSLQVLRLQSTICYNHPLDHLPSSLKELYLSRKRIQSNEVNASLDHLPSSLLLLHLDGYNVHVDHLPSSLKNLSLGHDFNLPVDHLPSFLSCLKIGCTTNGYFNEPLDHLPQSLSSLTLLTITFYHPLDHLPSFLSKLTLMIADYTYPLDHLPKSLIRLFYFVNNVVNIIPHCTTRLYLYCGHYQYESLLPTTITHLRISRFASSLPLLPSSLTTLLLCDAFNQPLDSLNLPHSLTTLRICSEYYYNETCFNQPIDKLPPSLTMLELGDGFNHPISCLLPSSLTCLSIGNYFNQPVDVLPSSLKYLFLGHSFNHPLDSLPPSIRGIQIKRVTYSHPLDNLPSPSVRVDMSDEYWERMKNIERRPLIRTVLPNFFPDVFNSRWNVFEEERE